MTPHPQEEVPIPKPKVDIFSSYTDVGTAIPLPSYIMYQRFNNLMRPDTGIYFSIDYTKLVETVRTINYIMNNELSFDIVSNNNDICIQQSSIIKNLKTQTADYSISTNYPDFNINFISLDDSSSPHEIKPNNTIKKITEVLQLMKIMDTEFRQTLTTYLGNTNLIQKLQNDNNQLKELQKIHDHSDFTVLNIPLNEYLNKINEELESAFSKLRKCRINFKDHLNSHPMIKEKLNLLETYNTILQNVKNQKSSNGITTVDTLKNRIATQQTEIHSLNENIQNCAYVINDANKDIANLKKKNNMLNTENKNLKLSLTKEQGKPKQLEEQLGMLIDDNKNKERQISTTTALKDAFQIRNEELMTKYDTMQAELQDENSRLEQELAVEKGKLLQIKDKIEKENSIVLTKLHHQYEAALEQNRTAMDKQCAKDRQQILLALGNRIKLIP